MSVAIREKAWQDTFTEMAEVLGWTWAHFRPAMNRRGQWQTPVAGPLGKGWPDLYLVRVRDGREMFVELKGDGGTISPDQERVLNVLGRAGRETHVWWPGDFERAAAALR